jgi:hypothetical protein
MNSDVPGEGVLSGFRVDTVSLEEMRQKLVEVRDYFQCKVDTLGGLELALGSTFRGGHEGETGAFKAAYERFGATWLGQFEKMLALDQAFVNLINEQGEAVKSAITMYDETEKSARATLEAILRDMG